VYKLVFKILTVCQLSLYRSL